MNRKYHSIWNSFRIQLNCQKWSTNNVTVHFKCAPTKSYARSVIKLFKVLFQIPYALITSTKPFWCNKWFSFFCKYILIAWAQGWATYNNQLLIELNSSRLVYTCSSISHAIYGLYIYTAFPTIVVLLRHFYRVNSNFQSETELSLCS